MSLDTGGIAPSFVNKKTMPFDNEWEISLPLVLQRPAGSAQTFRSVVILRPCWKGFLCSQHRVLPNNTFNQEPQSVELGFTFHGAYTFPTNVVQISPHLG